MKKGVFIILNNVRSLHNVGAIFRVAEAAGVKKIFLCGITGYPKAGEEWARNAARIAKTALGAERVVPWEYHRDIIPLLKKLKRKGVRLFALEQTPKSIDFRKAKYKFPLALILGHEREGIEKKILGLADQIIEIPMYGKIKESLNVAVACGIAVYEIIS